MAKSADCCDVGSDLRLWLIDLVGQWVGDAVHQDHVPRGPSSPCKLPAPYIWFSRSDTDTEECLGSLEGHPLLTEEEAGVTGPDTESFDVEVWGCDMAEVQCIARQIQLSAPYQGKFGSIWAQLVTITSQSDDYFFKGIDQGYAEGGNEAISLSIDVCPVCISKGTNDGKG